MTWQAAATLIPEPASCGTDRTLAAKTEIRRRTAKPLDACDVSGIQRGTSGDNPHTMVFGLTVDVSGPDQLPRNGDPGLQQILRDASTIVASIHW